MVYFSNLSPNPFSSGNAVKGENVTCWLEENNLKRQAYLKMVAGKSSMSANSLDGSLEVGKRT